MAGEGVEDDGGVWGLPVGENEEATVGSGDDMVVADKRQVLADDTTTDGVHQEA
jgi:hypothetical protein